jgi:hypothetical protein
MEKPREAINSNALALCGTIKGAGTHEKRTSSFQPRRALLKESSPIVDLFILSLSLSGWAILSKGIQNAWPPFIIALVAGCICFFLLTFQGRIPNTLTEEDSS